MVFIMSCLPLLSSLSILSCLPSSSLLFHPFLSSHPPCLKYFSPYIKKRGGKEGRREGGREGESEGGREGGREGGKGGKEGESEGRREGGIVYYVQGSFSPKQQPAMWTCTYQLFFQVQHEYVNI